MSLKVHTVKEFLGVSLGTTVADLHKWPLEGLNGPVSMSVYNPTEGVQLVKLQQSKDDSSYTDIAALTATVQPGSQVLVSGIVGARYCKLVGNSSGSALGVGLSFVEIIYPAFARAGLDVRIK